MSHSLSGVKSVLLKNKVLLTPLGEMELIVFLIVLIIPFGQSLGEKQVFFFKRGIRVTLITLQMVQLFSHFPSPRI